METPLISVIVVTWNRKEDVLETVQSVYNQAYQNVEIIVIDNASIDGTVDALRQAYPQVRLIALNRNAGATGGRNAGIAAARGSIVFILDSDASLGSQTLPRVVQKFQADPTLGIIGCKIVNLHSEGLDRDAGWIFTERDKPEFEMEFPSYSFSEGGAAIRKQVFDRVGPFWDLLFFGREGDDLSLRAWDAGYQVRYCPEAIVYHRASLRKRLVGGEREYYDLRNSLYIYLVRYPWWMLVGMLPLKIASSLVKGVRRDCLSQVVRALWDVERRLPFVWKLRRPIRNETARYYLKLQRQHGPLSWNLVSWLKYKA
jgi:hypothetical protein